MPVNIAISQRVRVSKAGSLSFSSRGLESNTFSTWFCFGFKRTDGAPTTLADLSVIWQGRLDDFDHGSFNWAEPTRHTGVVAINALSGNSPPGLEGDHLYFVIMSGSPTPPDGSATFDATKALGTLKP